LSDLTSRADGLFVSPWRVFLTSFTLLFAFMAIWSLATPLFASPDEPAHVARAVSLVRGGELLGHSIRGANPAYTEVTIPALYAEGPTYAGCYAFKDTVPASCNPALTAPDHNVVTRTYVGRYPPLYYAIVGLPSLFTVSTAGLYLMRIMSDLLGAIYLALAVMSVTAWSKNRLLFLGLIVAVTPMTVFLSSVVNPSGLEITAATCLWCSALILVTERSSDPPTGLVAVVVAAATGLMLVRGLSPLWVALIVIVVACVAGRRALVSISRSRAVRLSLLILVPTTLFAVVWIVAARALDLLPLGIPVGRDETRAHLLASIIGDTGFWIQQMIGLFGWLDTYSPLLTYLIWYAALSLFALLALVCYQRLRDLAALVLLILIVLIVPILITYEQAHHVGIDWQGRYILPMAVGIPLLSAVMVGRSDLLHNVQARLALVVCALVGIGQIGAFAQTLRRYAVGLAGPLDYLHGSWRPPLGAGLLTAGAVIAMALLMAFVYRLFMVQGVGIAGPTRAHDREDLLATQI